MRDDRNRQLRPKADRKARLAEQLRANLQKRKAQARARRSGDADEPAGRHRRRAKPAQMTLRPAAWLGSKITVS